MKWQGGGVPAEGIHDYIAEAKELFKTFPDNRVENRPNKVFFTQGDGTCSVSKFTGTTKGPRKWSNGEVISPTNKSFEVDFCTVAHWLNGEIVEENLFL